MKTLIQHKLKEIEQSHSIRILHACETGSRAWGFASPDSDYDVRLIYMHEPDWYLSLSEQRDSLELMLDDGNLDITGWDLRKCLRLLWKSNGALLERVQSPEVYYTEAAFMNELREQADLCFSPIASIYHYLGLAKNSFAELEGRQEIRLKTLFYALRAALACQWILEKGTKPPIVFRTMTEGLVKVAALKQRLGALTLLKASQNESHLHPVETDLMNYVGELMLNAEREAMNLGGSRNKEASLDALFKRTLKMHAQ